MNDKQLSPDAFAQKYTQQHADRYYHKHKQSVSRRVSNWLEQRIAKSALKSAGDPEVVLDLPCGAGRFWPLLGDKKNRQIIAADNSEHMLHTATKYCDDDVRSQLETLHTSAYDIQLGDNTVDNIFCMRLLHHIGDKNDRLKILKEFHRVTRDTVCISLWIDGNYKAKRRQKSEARRESSDNAYQNRFVFSRRMVEKEFREVGFEIIAKHDFAKYYSMWRVYTLRKIKPH